MNDDELHKFFLDLTAQLQDRGAVCAVTSGLACVHFGAAETTKDCDLLCHPGAFGILLDVLEQTPRGGLDCEYRGIVSAPLAAPWHAGGWTSHFHWGSVPEAVSLDVSGSALRSSVPWQQELDGLYVSPHVVAEMKRTHRTKDWGVITALGLYLIEQGDARGWLHIFDETALEDLLRQFACPGDMANRRPALSFAMRGDARFRGALVAERLFWERLDSKRLQIYERALRPYHAALRRSRSETRLTLREDHQKRLACAEATLPKSPLKDYGLERYIQEAKLETISSSGLREEALDWLPDVVSNFQCFDS